MAGRLIPVFFSSRIQISWNFRNVSKVSLHLAISGCSSPAAFIRRKALYRSRCTGCPPTSFFHRVPYGADDLLCRQGIHIPFPLFLLYGDPAVELVFGQAVFHTEGRKFFFLPFPFPVCPWQPGTVCPAGVPSAVSGHEERTACPHTGQAFSDFREFHEQDGSRLPFQVFQALCDPIVGIIRESS